MLYAVLVLIYLYVRHEMEDFCLNMHCFIRIHNKSFTYMFTVDFYNLGKLLHCSTWFHLKVLRSSGLICSSTGQNVAGASETLM